MDNKSKWHFNLKWKFILLTVVIAFSSSIIKSYNDYQTDLEFIEIAEKDELNFVQTLIRSTFTFELKNDAQMASLVAKMPPIIQAVKERNKADLIQMTGQMMQVQHDAYALGNAEFTLPPGIAFHNVYNPKRSEGEPKEQSDLVLQTLQKNESREGIELVYDGISIRGAAPLPGENNQAAGSFVLAIDIQEPLNSIKEITGFDVGVLIDSDSWLSDGPGSLTTGGAMES